MSLFPSRNSKNIAHATPKAHKLLTPLYEQPFCHYLLPTLGIHELSCSLAVLDQESVEALGTLPHLERLTVYKSSDIPTARFEDVLLPERSFSSLKYLRLNLPTSANVDWAMRIPSLLANIKLLTINIEHPNPRNEHLIEHPFFSALAHATQLENLNIIFNGYSGGEMLEIGSMSVFCNILGTLPLKRAFFVLLVLPCDNFHEMNFGPAWPQVTHLYIPAAQVFFDILPFFAQLPKLEYLLICLVIDTDCIDMDMPKPTQELNLHTLEGSSESEVWHRRADMSVTIS
ncbi:hypothetical protein FRC07_013138, partial [Ceratobasidium sp. 392]